MMLSRSIMPFFIRFAQSALQQYLLSLSQHLYIPSSSNSLVNAVFFIHLSTKPERTSRKYQSLFELGDRQEEVVHAAATTCNSTLRARRQDSESTNRTRGELIRPVHGQEHPSDMQKVRNKGVKISGSSYFLPSRRRLGAITS